MVLSEIKNVKNRPNEDVQAHFVNWAKRTVAQAATRSSLVTQKFQNSIETFFLITEYYILTIRMKQ